MILEYFFSETFFFILLSVYFLDSECEQSNSHFIVSDPCFKAPHVSLLPGCLNPAFLFFLFLTAARNFLFKKN